MKILSINNAYYIRGGADRYFFELNKLLESRGEEVIPFSVKDRLNFYTPFEPFFLSYVNFFGPKSPTDYTKILTRVLYSFEAKDKIKTLIERTKPEVAHIHNIYHNISPSVFGVLKRYGIPIVLTLHDFELICPIYTLYSGGQICQRCKGRRFYHAVLNRCKENSWLASLLCCIKSYFHNAIKAHRHIDMFIAPSRFVRDKIIEFGFDPGRIACFPHFVDFQGLALNCNHDGYIVYLGRLHKTKGLFTLIRAMRGMSNCQLRIVGDGPFRDELQKTIEVRGLNNIKIMGYKQGPELTSIIGGCNFTIVPSEYYELCSLSILESFALGKPVIGSRVGAIPEIIEDGVDGLLFEPGDADDLNQKIKYLIDHQDVLAQMGRSAKQKAEREYNPQIHYDRIMRVYGEAMGRQA